MKTTTFPSATILVVDDNAGSAKTLRFVLSAEGYHADCVGSAAEALERARAAQYDVALIDINLRDGSGLDLLSDLKAQQADLIAIVVTGHASTENSIDAINRGASGYVQKPVEAQQLLSLLRSGLERKWLQEENARMVRRLRLVHSIGATATLGLDPEVTLQDTISLVTALLDFEAGAIWRGSGVGGELELMASVGLSPELDAHCRRHVSSVAKDIRADRSLRERPWFDVIEEVEEGAAARFLRLVPLRGQEGISGWMAVGGLDAQPSQTEEAEVLGAVAGQVGVAMENMMLYENLRVAHQRLQQAQAQLVQSEKLSALGGFISGIAHEINNPLMAIVGYSELLAQGDGGEDTPELADRIFRQAQRCARIVQSVSIFARAHRAGTAEVALNAILMAAAETAAHNRPPEAEIELRLSPDLKPVTGDPDAFRQAFVNIINNAYQSLDGQGTGKVTVATQAANRGVLVEVSDTGPGIPEHVLPKVFDPFFTTKGVGHAPGLGLSVAHGIVQAHGGHIQAGNRPEGGARITVFLPEAGTGPPADQPPELARAHRDPLLADLSVARLNG